MKRYQVLARALGAKARCDAAGNTEWSERWADRIKTCMDDFPHGSGFDSGTTLDETSTPERLVFDTAFHHMDEAGGYDGWTEHQVIITPSLEMGWRMRITGRDRNGIKEYMGEMFAYTLDEEIEEYAKAQ